jgi:GNAT superfamily N-acetyltransferase
LKASPSQKNVAAEEYRSRGIGKKLITVVEELAEKEAPAIVDLTSGLRRAGDGTHDFYKRCGSQNNGPMAKLYLRKEFWRERNQ